MGELNSLITKFKESETVKALDRYFSEKSMMEVLGVDRDENAHSNFLAWLFENEVTGKEACRLLIELLKEKAKDTLKIIDRGKKDYTNLTKQVTDLSNFLNKKPLNIRAIREDYICMQDEVGRKMEGRCDIILIVNNSTSEIHIIIENKVKSLEKVNYWKEIKDNKWCRCDDITIGQTEFYYNYYSKNEKNNVYVFLTIPDKDNPKSESFIHITYQNIMDGVLVPLMGFVADDGILLTIRDYIKALGINYFQDEVMAVEPGVTNLANKIWDENSELLTSLLHSEVNRETQVEVWNGNYISGISNRDVLRPLVQIFKVISKNDNDAKKLYRVINKKDGNNHDGTTYRYKEKGEKDWKIIDGKNALFRFIVGYYMFQFQIHNEKHELPSVKHLQSIFPPSLHGKTTSAREGSSTDNNIILQAQKSDYINIFDKKSEFEFWNKMSDQIVQDAQPIFICQTGWDGPAMMSRLIRYVETLKEFENIKILEIPLFLK